MKFTLHYRGPLPSNGGPGDKCRIRNALMPQLKDVWKHMPLDQEQWLDPEYELTTVKDVAGQPFSAIVTDTHNAVAELNILFLRPEPVGGLVTPGGDIDNRMKTLLDALSIPHPGQLSDKHSHDQFGGISHCLLEDDNLICGLNISVDRLLGPAEENEVLLVLTVRIRRTAATLKNLDFAA